MHAETRSRILFACVTLAAAGGAFAQGQDGTPGERNLQVMAELLAGIYDNANQAYFDRRLEVPEDRQHVRAHVRIEAAAAGGGGEPQFTFALFRNNAAEANQRELWRLVTDADPLLVRMQRHALGDGAPTYREGCDVLWRRDAGHFSGRNDSADCPSAMQLNPRALWLGSGKQTGGANEVPMQLIRAREFSCYVDVPGVAGGRDEPFDRYPIDDMHDQGALQWFDTKEGRTLGIMLRNVRWPMNNEIGAFTRNSLVMYVLEKTPDDGVKTVTYGWTEPRAERIGVNLQWMLVNCFMVSNRDVRPYFD